MFPIPETRTLEYQRRQRLLAELPNQQGFAFIGVKRDGSEVSCVVARHHGGSHYVRLAGPGALLFSELIAWRNT